jgi:ATP-binding cassette subfamily A (ABC1) protein 3
MTLEDQTKSDLQGSQNLIFFLSIAFSLIPANFITIIIKEREMNTKHLQIISGISYTSYWLSNFIFEMVKYLFTGGVCLILIILFGSYSSEDKNIMILLYVLYGFSMISITYLLSFIFTKESSAQNFTILLNYLFGPLACTVVFVLRINPGTVEVAKALSYVFSIFPSFSFAFGMNQLFR